MVVTAFLDFHQMKNRHAKKNNTSPTPPTSLSLSLSLFSLSYEPKQRTFAGDVLECVVAPAHIFILEQ